MEKGAQKDTQSRQKDTQSRKWQITINNPLDKGYTHDSIKESVGTMRNVIYWCMCDEIAKTPHTHLFVQFKNPVYFSSIKKTFPSAHIEEEQGTAEENRAYIRKDGKWENTEKESTNLKETFEEWGTMPQTGQGRRSDTK